MPLQATPPPQAREVAQCERPALFTRLEDAAAANPALVFACAGLLPHEAQRGRVLRNAFISAMAAQPALALSHLPHYIDKPWITDGGFFAVESFAMTIAAAQPRLAQALLEKAARRYPGIALREYSNYGGFAFGPAVLAEAAVAAPDEAVGLAMGGSISAEALRDALQASRETALPLLARIATDESIPIAVRPRVGIFANKVAQSEWTYGRAVSAASGPGYFPALVALRIAASGNETALLDRSLESYAEVLFRTAEDRTGGALSSELRHLTAAETYALLTYGRTEEDDALFGMLFDRLLLPKLRVTPPGTLLNQVRDLNIRRFLATAAAHHRLEAFLAQAKTPAARDALLCRAVHGIDAAEHPLDEMLAAAEAFEAVQDPARLSQIEAAIAMEYAHAGQEDRVLYGLLAASVARRLPNRAEGEASQLAATYTPLLKAPRVLDAAALYSGDGICVQQYFFYDDDDAAESFDSFKQTYASDPAWHWEDRAWYVHVSGRSGGRSIEVYANVPYPLNGPHPDDRRLALTRLLAGKAIRPSVLVHRGHTWYVAQTLQYLTHSVKLVYLGSCHGMENAYSVMAMAQQAQMIATRGIGTLTVNDPLLKALNEELLRGPQPLDWMRFWKSQQPKLGHNPQWGDYIPPPRNVAAILLSAYHNYLAN